MSNPARAPKELTSAQLLLSSAPDAYLPEHFAQKAALFKKVEEAQKVLGGLDMRVERTITIPRELTVCSAVHMKSGPSLAKAKIGVPVPRPRSAYAKALVNQAYGKLPDTGFAAQSVVGASMRGKVYVEVGAEGALGRLAAAYPRVGMMPARPVTRGEAVAAVRRCGITLDHLPAHALRAYPLVPSEQGEAGITVNPNSDNGFPVLGKWSTPGAAKMCQELAVSVRKELLLSRDVNAWLREAEDRRPWLVALRGKAKADYYSPEKIVEARVRFYNAFPRQMMLNMQIATQVLEHYARNILTEEGCTSGIGVSLVRGGAADLVAALDAQLHRAGVAYVHVGDDSWVAVKRGREVVMFALDCSNFDLTQHRAVTQEVHEAIREQLALVDEKAAALWHAYARERVVVTTGTLVRRFLHAGASGMPLQSKVNDVLMDVMLDRLAVELGDRSESAIEQSVRRVGADMGFSVRLEQFAAVRAETLQEALELQPFLFIGYYFHVRGGEVRACADIPRTFAQVPYPALKWCKSDKELLVTEAMRLGSISLNLGMPTRELDAAFETFREEARALVQRALDAHGDVQDPRLRWAVQESPWALPAQSSLAGLLRAMDRDPAQLWMVREAELPSTSLWVAVEGTSWADMVEAEEEPEWRPPSLSVQGRTLPQGRVPTHPVTSRNDGRPPPTAVWGPNRPPRDTWAPSARQRRRDGIARREFEESLALWSEDDSDAWE